LCSDSSFRILIVFEIGINRIVIFEVHWFEICDIIFAVEKVVFPLKFKLVHVIRIDLVKLVIVSSVWCFRRYFVVIFGGFWYLWDGD
jgi:hypothetical protein